MSLIILILLIVGDADPELPTEADPVTWQALKDAARLLDLWDREDGWNLSFDREVRWRRVAYVNCLDRPPSRDIERFPDRQTCCRMLDFSQAYKRHLQALPNLGREEIDDALEETCLLEKPWIALHNAHMPGDPCIARRSSLADLYRLLGDEAYGAGQLPPPVPIWRFQEIR